MRKQTVGSSLTQRTIQIYDYEEWMDEAAKDPHFLARALPTYRDRLLDWQKWATRVLAKAGRPTTNNWIEIRGDGTWRPAKFLARRRQRRRIIVGLSYADEQGEEEKTLEWYAAKILRIVELELSRMKKGRAARKFTNAEEQRLAELHSRGLACELGSTVERVRWKFTLKDQMTSFQKSGIRGKRHKVEERGKPLEPIFAAAIKKSKKQLEGLGLNEIIHLMRKVDPKAVGKFKLTTLRRHVERFQERQVEKDSTSA